MRRVWTWPRFAISRWLLGRGVIDHVDRVKSLLEGLMGLPGLPWRLAVLALGELVVPFDRTGGRTIGRVRCHRGAPRRRERWPRRNLGGRLPRRRVGVLALSGSRAGASRYTSAAERLGFPSPVASPPSPPAHSEDHPFPEGPSDRLALDGGNDLLVGRCSGANGRGRGFCDLARRESPQSGFDWRPVLVRLLDRYPSDDLTPLLAPSGSRGSRLWTYTGNGQAASGGRRPRRGLPARLARTGGDRPTLLVEAFR